MTDAECVHLLQWALSRLRMRWPAFRRVRGQVCKRIARRMQALGLPDAAAYQAFLVAHPEEWPRLDGMCTVTLSRFYRDRAAWEFVCRDVLPELARTARASGEGALRAWSAGCGSGEEPYTLVLAWQMELAAQFPGVELSVLATDTNGQVLERAMRARYSVGSLKDLPEAWRARGFTQEARQSWLRPEHRERVTFMRHDVRAPAPEGPFRLIACRNLAFTYYELDLQRQVAESLRGALEDGGALLLGVRETLPAGVAGFAPWSAPLRVYRKGA